MPDDEAWLNTEVERVARAVFAGLINEDPPS